jgi:CheY-like chemotaxis protein
MGARNSECVKLAKKTILMVEQELLLSILARKRLEALDCTIIGPTLRVPFALQQLETGKVDAAILDIFLEERSFLPLVERLDELHIPYVFAASDLYDDHAMHFPGFVLSDNSRDLDRIARRLFS